MTKQIRIAPPGTDCLHVHRHYVQQATAAPRQQLLLPVTYQGPTPYVDCNPYACAGKSTFVLQKGQPHPSTPACTPPPMRTRWLMRVAVWYPQAAWSCPSRAAPPGWAPGWAGAGWPGCRRSAAGPPGPGRAAPSHRRRPGQPGREQHVLRALQRTEASYRYRPTRTLVYSTRYNGMLSDHARTRGWRSVVERLRPPAGWPSPPPAPAAWPAAWPAASARTPPAHHRA